MRKPAQVERRPRGTLSREQLLDTAAGLFNERGYDRTSMNDIAAALMITKPALYHYFACKEDILTSSIERATTIIEAALAKGIPVDGTPVSQLEAFIAVYARTLLIPVFRSMAMADDRVLESAGKAAIRRCKRNIHQRLQSLLEEAIAAGAITPVDPKAATQAIFGVFNWAALTSGKDLTQPIEKLLGVMQYMLCGGLLVKKIGLQLP